MMKSWGWKKVKKGRMKYFSFDKIPYLYDNEDEEFMAPSDALSLEPDLKIAG